MKFKVLSDLHLEFFHLDPWKPPVKEDDKDTILLLAGDINLGNTALPWIEEMCSRFECVVYILGNHEFYHNEWYTVKEFWRNIDISNFEFLDDDVVNFEDKVRIIGSTLWTKIIDDLSRESIFRMECAGSQMNDYRIAKIKPKPIYDSVGKKPQEAHKRALKTTDTRAAHIEAVKFLKEELAKPWPGKTIVMTHHLPSEQSVDPMFRGHNLNPFYMTNLDYLMKENDIDVWIHGHTHTSVDKTIHGTRIICNPMGYHGYEENKNFNEDLTFDTF